ncbi:MAG: hypothetical protein MUO58_15780 [Anaerolineales bacterium]|nr:hypothetical protein [Anaerolineales bacterium]
MENRQLLMREMEKRLQALSERRDPSYSPYPTVDPFLQDIRKNSDSKWAVETRSAAWAFSS